MFVKCFTQRNESKLHTPAQNKSKLLHLLPFADKGYLAANVSLSPIFQPAVFATPAVLFWDYSLLPIVPSGLSPKPLVVLHTCCTDMPTFSKLRVEATTQWFPLSLWFNGHSQVSSVVVSFFESNLSTSGNCWWSNIWAKFILWWSFTNHSKLLPFNRTLIISILEIASHCWSSWWSILLSTAVGFSYFCGGGGGSRVSMLFAGTNSTSFVIFLSADLVQQKWKYRGLLSVLEANLQNGIFSLSPNT